MLVVIDILKQDYERVVHDDRMPVARMRNAIRNGTPLPKWCGRLIDAEELKKEYPRDTDWDYPVNTNRYVVESIDNAPTIIEADKKSEE